VAESEVSHPLEDCAFEVHDILLDIAAVKQLMAVQLPPMLAFNGFGHYHGTYEKVSEQWRVKF
jgi:hypothetical protein